MKGANKEFLIYMYGSVLLCMSEFTFSGFGFVSQCKEQSFIMNGLHILSNLSSASSRSKQKEFKIKGKHQAYHSKEEHVSYICTLEKLKTLAFETKWLFQDGDLCYKLSGSFHLLEGHNVYIQSTLFQLFMMYKVIFMYMCYSHFLQDLKSPCGIRC